MFVDSHCHLQLIDYDVLGITEQTVITNAKVNNIKHFLCVATRLEQHAKLLVLCKQYSEICMSVGMHPTELSNIIEPDKTDYLALVNHKHIIAIGETGLDYYKLTNDIETQKKRFKTQIQVAIDCQKPLIIHTRKATKDTIQILKEENAKNVGGVIHCFTEDQDFADEALAMGLYISFSGIITFKHSRALQDIAKRVPLDRILIETDCPYLTPVPYRGKINQPSHIIHTAHQIAKLREIKIEEFAQHTTKNYKRLFNVNV